jgi:hypothetical protein
MVLKVPGGWVVVLCHWLQSSSSFKGLSAFILQHFKKKYTFLLVVLDPEDEDTIILQNMENYSLNDKASQQGQLASSLLHQYHTK